MTIALAVVLSMWFLLSVANQVPALRRVFNGTLNSFCLLPALGLFAPEPSDVDYHLAWRDRMSDGTIGTWHEIAFEPAGWWRAGWNPNGRYGAAILQLVSALSILDGAVAPTYRNGERILLLSLPYLVLLNVVVGQPRDRDSVARQFMIVETTGFGADRKVAVGISSPFHPLDLA